jgi:glycine/D-amino acid oxidase-like deaminating enzyme/nitrite reductase/ring-hydroxylating ferredoxin subunit
LSVLPGTARSLWIETAPGPGFDSLEGEAKVDVAVIGAGIAGLTAAYLLKKAGKTVAVIESKEVLRGVTGYTTAKITSLHQLIYVQLSKKFGEDGARAYGRSNEHALGFIRDLVAEEGIDCDYETQDAYTYTEDPEQLDAIKQEASLANSLGLPASYVTDSSLPYGILGAVKFDDQAQFHPRKYLLHLAGQIPGDGSFIFENTRATGLDQGTTCAVTTDRGIIRAEEVFVATHLPIFDRGMFFAKAHPHRSYVITARHPGAGSLSGMYINAESPTRSIREVPYEGERLLLLSGEGHKVGQDLHNEERYAALEAFGRLRFGAEDFVHRWSAQDFTSVDMVPYIGRLKRTTDNVHVATGFHKWGMTNGTLAAMIVSDAILGRANPWASLYDAKRLKLAASAKEFVGENANVAQRFVGDRMNHPQKTSADELAPGEGGIVEVDGKKAAAYRREDGSLCAFSHVCTHLGCHVRWNPADTSFDCPCHGSRFDTEGKVIQGPAVKDLEPRRVPTDRS